MIKQLINANLSGLNNCKDYRCFNNCGKIKNRITIDKIKTETYGKNYRRATSL